MPLIRVARGNGDTLTERHVSARQKVSAAITHVGGIDSPAGRSCRRTGRAFWSVRSARWSSTMASHPEPGAVLHRNL